MNRRAVDPPAAARNSGGFTVIEMLVVMMILGLVAALAVPVVRTPPDSLRLETTARTLASALRLSRAHAIAENADVVLTIDADRRIYQSSAVSPTRIDPDIAVEMVLAAPERRRNTAGAIRFFADGTSSGGDITLRLGTRRARILVNWLTGEARLNLGSDDSS